MQTIIQVFTTGNTSLRETITGDQKLEEWRLKVLIKQKPGRQPGWAKVGSVDPDIRGTINMDWDSSARILSCRVVTKQGNKPSDLIGDFIAYLIERHGRRIRTINLVPG